ncbi:hypothetical protein [Negadavirga shengliensis]|uniref:6-bladed beta-propeller protein n=1 Tax=Negadavirga shengliensis TaxID=1389218 RepID=A0ABV9SWB7_9BACT
MSKYSKVILFISPYGIFLLLIIILESCGGEPERSESPPASLLKMEILDSLMVDHIGSLAWCDINGENNLFLGMDTQTKDVLIIDRNGKTLRTFNKTGEYPEAVGSTPFASPKFRNGDEWILAGQRGVFTYDIHDGKPVSQTRPEFTPLSNVLNVDADFIQTASEEKALAYYPGREGEFSFYTRAEGLKMEWIDLKKNTFEGVIPYPEASKFNSEEVYIIIFAQPVFATSGQQLFLAFKNDPVLYEYHWDNLETPVATYPLDLMDFQQRPGVDPNSVNLGAINIDYRDFFFGSLDKLFNYENGSLVLQYRNGLNQEKYSELSRTYPDSKDFLWNAGLNNKTRFALIDSLGQIHEIGAPPIVGSLEFIDNKGFLWSSPTETFERDYEVIYRTRLISE